MSDSSLQTGKDGGGISDDVSKPVKPRSSLLRFFLKAAVVLILLVLLPVGFLILRPTAFDLSRFAGAIDSQVTEALGREVTFGGEIVFVTGFVPSVRIEDITVENPHDWKGGGRFAHLERFQTSVGLIELFHREVNIDDIRIEGLDISLERNEENIGNWEGLAEVEKRAESSSEEPFALLPVEDDEREGLDLDFKELGGISIENITASYLDSEQPEKNLFKLERLEGSARLGHPVQLSLEGNYLQLPFRGEFKAGTLTQLRARSREWPVEVTGKLGATSIHLVGQFSAEDFSVPGLIKFDVDIPHLGELLPITGKLPDFGSVQISGEAQRTSLDHYSLPDLTGHVGKEELSGSMKLNFSEDFPRFDGKLKIAALDVRDLRAMHSSDGRGDSGNNKEESAVKITIDEKLEQLKESLIPFVGSLRLDINEIRGAGDLGSIHKLGIEAAIEKGKATAEVNVEFAGAPYRGSLALMRIAKEKDISFEARLKSENAELSDLIAYYAKNDRFIGSVERVNYKIGGSGENLMEAWFDRRVDLEVIEAKMTYRGEGKDWRFFVSKGTMLREGNEPGKVQLEGVISDAPFEVTLSYESEIVGVEAGTYFHSMEGKVADLEFRLDNKIDENAEQGDANFSFQLKGGNLGELDLIYEMDLPPLGPYSAEGVFRKKGDVLDFHQVALQIGSSKIQGGWHFERREGRPIMGLDLNAKTLQLDDFAFEDWSPTASKKKASSDALDTENLSQATLLPSILSHEVLNSLDMNLKLQVGEVLSGKDRLGRGNLTAVLENSRLKIEPLKLGVPGGYFEGNLFFYPKKNGSLDWNVQLRADSFELGVLARRAKSDSKLSAKANIDAELSANNASFGRPQLNEATGKLNLTVCPYNIDAGALDIWATNLIFAILPNINSANKSKINCLVADLRLENGVILPQTLGLDTTRLRVGAEGKIDLSGDQYDLKLTPFPKSPQLFSLELPIGVSGTLDAPKIETGSFLGFRALGRMTANTVLFPVKFIVDERLPADGNDLCPCAETNIPEVKKTESKPPKQKEERKGFFRRIFGGWIWLN